MVNRSSDALLGVRFSNQTLRAGSPERQIATWTSRRLALGVGRETALLELIGYARTVMR